MRKTPEEIAVRAFNRALDDFLDTLEQEGYIIVHPDDVPAADMGTPQYNQGYNACRRSIFDDYSGKFI